VFEKADDKLVVLITSCSGSDCATDDEIDEYINKLEVMMVHIEDIPDFSIHDNKPTD
jgi:hypothetical protein